MRILILHRVPFVHVRYDNIIDHNNNEILYIGKEENLNEIPSNIPCKKLILHENMTFFEMIKKFSEEFYNIDRVVSSSQYELKNASLISAHPEMKV